MALGVNQTYKNYYTIRLGTLTTKHQIQSNRIMLFTNEVSDIANRINFFENQRVLALSTPEGKNLAIRAEYFDLPRGFDPNDSTTWGDDIKYTTPCQKQIFIYHKLGTYANESEAQASGLMENTTNSLQEIDGIWYEELPYDADENGNYTAEAFNDSRLLSSKLMSGEYTFVFDDDSNTTTVLPYESLMFISEQQDQTAYQESIERLESERNQIQSMQKKVQQEMSTTEIEIQAIQSLMESTDKVLPKNLETFKWG